MPQIHNTGEYIVVMGNASRKAMDFCLKKCMQDLQKSIANDLYGAYYPTDYARTSEMYDAWELTATANRGTLMFLSAKLSRNPALGQHTSIMGMGSLGDMILDTLEAGYQGFNAKTGKFIPARPFWTKWLAKIDRKAGRWYAQGLRQQGLTVIG